MGAARLPLCRYKVYTCTFAWLYSLLLFRALHLLLTIVAWQHFFQNKYYVQLANVTKTGMAMPDMCNL